MRKQFTIRSQGSGTLWHIWVLVNDADSDSFGCTVYEVEAPCPNTKIRPRTHFRKAGQARSAGALSKEVSDADSPVYGQPVPRSPRIA